MTFTALFLILKTWWRPIVLVLGLAALTGVFFIAKGCYVSYRQRLTSNSLGHFNGIIGNDEFQGNALDAERERRKQEVTNAQTNANKLIDNANRVRHTDSGQFNANASAVRDRFCVDYPDDSLCR